MSVVKAAVMIVILLAKGIANEHVREEVAANTVGPVHLHLHLHPTIILNNLSQVVPIVLEDARIVVPLGVVPLVMKNAGVDANQLVREHVLVGALVHAKMVAKTLAKQDVKTPVILVAKTIVNGIAM